MSDVLQESAESKEPSGHLDPIDFDRRVVFRTYIPPDDLKPFLKYFWILSWRDLKEPYYSEQVMQGPFVDIFVAASESGVQGTFKGKRTYVAQGEGRIIGVRFLPGAFHLFWKGSMTDLQDKDLVLSQVFPKITEQITERMRVADDQAAITILLEALRAKCPQLDPNVEIITKIVATVEASSDMQSVASIAKSFGKSERWLQQLFQDYVGIGLKWLLQRNRLLAAAQQIRDTESPDWTRIAYDLGYSSQQYFITDFKKATGKTPTQYKSNLSQG